MRARRPCFGGFNLERSVNNSCSARPNNPNLLAFCDQADSGIPWQKSFKRRAPTRCRSAASPSAVRCRPGGLPPRHRRAALRRVHRRHRLRQSERPGHVPAGDADHELRRQLHRPLHARALRHPRPDGGALNVPLRGAGDGVHAAPQPDGLLVQQEVHASAASACCRRSTSSTHSTLMTTRRWRRRSTARHLPAALDHPAGPHHPPRRGRELVGT